MMNISRRSFLNQTLAASAVPMLVGLSGCDVEPEGVYAHGIASGDPLSDRVILWTHITIPKEMKVDLDLVAVGVKWEVSSDRSFSSIVAQGRVTTSKARDFTVKVDATGLAPNTQYFYRFETEGLVSPVGRTKTLPTGKVDEVRLAMTSCSHHAFGYFNVYAQIAKLDNIDAVLHLGDYLYEYGKNDIYNNAFLISRQHQPAHEMVSLSDYRTRHAQYKRDADSKAMLQKHPLIAIWDDHEFANDAWKGGAENHDPAKEGSWEERARNAVQAYYEWMPIRPPNEKMKEKAYRQFSFGNLLSLNMLDTRYIGRDKQIKSFDGSEKDPARTLLGLDQERWLLNNLRKAQDQGVKWKFLGQQVQMLQLRMFGKYLNKDSWDGYQASRDRLLSFIEKEKIDNVIVLTGDVHSSWAAEIAKDPYSLNDYDPFTGKGALAVEFVTPSTTSPSIPVPGLQQLVGDAGKVLHIENQHIKYIDFKNRGFVTITIRNEQVKADWHHVPHVAFKNNQVFVAQTAVVRDGQAKLIMS